LIDDRGRAKRPLHLAIALEVSEVDFKLFLRMKILYMCREEPGIHFAEPGKARSNNFPLAFCEFAR